MVKRTERLSLYNAMSQAADDMGDNMPVLLYRRNRQPWVAVVYLDDLVKVAEAVARAGRGLTLSVYYYGILAHGVT